MEKELQSDLTDALEGIDIVELLAGDSELLPVAQEIWNVLDDEDVSDEELEGGEDVATTADQSPSSSSANASSQEDPASPKQSRTRVPKPSCPCQVCRKPAKGYKYFGVRVCYGCRAFFARSVKNRVYLNYECSRDSGDCLDDSESWLKCQRCRFAKCLEFGMAIQSKSIYGKVEMAERLLKEWGVKGASRRLLKKARMFLSPTCLLTLDEKLNIEAYTSRVLAKSYRNMVTLMGSDMDIFESALRLYYHGTHFPLALQKSVHKYLHYAGGKDFLENCDNQFDKLTVKDRSRLIAGNFEIASEFIDAYRLEKREQLTLEVQSFIDTVKINTSKDYAQAVDKIHSKVSYGTTIVLKYLNPQPKVLSTLQI